MKRRSPGTLLAKASANPAVAADDPPTRTAAPVAPTTAADSMLNRAESHLERKVGQRTEIRLVRHRTNRLIVHIQ